MKMLLVGLIKLYRLLFAPFLHGHCRFTPSCSHYAEEALMTHGFWRGLWLMIYRILRCHPWCDGGLDLVPNKIANKAIDSTKQGLHTDG